MGGLNFRGPYEFDPETYGGEGGGLLGRLAAMMQHGQIQLSAPSGSPPNDGPEYDPGYYSSPQGGVLGRMLAPEATQDRYHPIAGNGWPSSLPPDPNFRRFAKNPNDAPFRSPGLLRQVGLDLNRRQRVSKSRPVRRSRRGKPRRHG